MTEVVKDQATVTPTGDRLQSFIDGVIVRPFITQTDERGDLCELYDLRWGVTPDPLVYVYAVTVHPGRIKGWAYHKRQMDRLAVLFGALKIVLFDMREESPTKGMINEFHLSERNRALLVIPPGVAHAAQGLGTTDAAFINMPTQPYNHAEPDKFRVPAEKVPYTFNARAGW